jgi:translation initiation factor 2B subunit (eIF-2B alpha/beta/delta family)
MANRWDVTVKGRNHEIRLDRAENGKQVIRVDGRVAAKPVGDDEFERRFAVDGFDYVLTRTAGNTFDVTPARYVAGIITEKGVARAPFQQSLRELVNQS